MYPLRVSLARPYWNSATYRAIGRTILSNRVVCGFEIEKLESAMRNKLGVDSVLLCDSGSFALEIVLRACGVGEGDEVVIPTFCCTAIVPPIVALGAVPVLADVGGDLNLTAENAKSALTGKTKAIVVAHLFGNPAEIGAIVALALEKNIRVIDDAAQALGATIDGRPVGTFGDAGIFSFGSEKVCSGIGGGVAISRRNGISDDIYMLIPRPVPVLRNFFSALVWRRWRRWTFPAEPLFLRSRREPEAPPALYRSEEMANLNAAVAATLLQTLSANIAARRARVRAYRELLGGNERLRLIPHRPGSACLTQVVRVLPARPGDDPAARAIAALVKAGYEVQGSYVPIHLLPAYKRYARGPLRYAERVWTDLIELPCEPDVSLDHVERIAAAVKTVVQS